MVALKDKTTPFSLFRSSVFFFPTHSTTEGKKATEAPKKFQLTASFLHELQGAGDIVHAGAARPHRAPETQSWLLFLSFLVAQSCSLLSSVLSRLRLYFSVCPATERQHSAVTEASHHRHD